MTDYAVSCDTFARLSRVLRDIHPDGNEWFRSIRLDGDSAVASNRRVMAVEQIATPATTPIHIIADPALIAQCEAEAKYNSVLTITYVDMLQYGTATTTLGYTHPTNVVVHSQEPNDMLKWRTVVPRSPAKISKGGMFWLADNIADLARSSPTGRVVFEEQISTDRGTIIRDIHDDRWFGVFLPLLLSERYSPATLPDWFK